MYGVPMKETNLRGMIPSLNTSVQSTGDDKQRTIRVMWDARNQLDGRVMNKIDINKMIDFQGQIRGA